MTIPMKVCKLHGRAHRVTEPCPWCEEPVHCLPAEEYQCPECHVRQYMYPGYESPCISCGGE